MKSRNGSAAIEPKERRRTAKRGNGEGGIYQRDSDGLWCASVSLANGTRKVIYGKTRQEVADKLNDLLTMKKQGLPLGPDRLTVGAYLAQWLEESAKPKLKPSTYRSYEQLIRVHLVSAGIRVGRLRGVCRDKSGTCRPASAAVSGWLS